MDGEAILYNQSLEKVCTLPAIFEEARSILKNHIKSKVSLTFLIDQTYQDIQEDKLPSLLPWDLLRLLYYKKTNCIAQGGYGGFRFFRQDKETYLRWIHIPKKDSRNDWLFYVFDHIGQVFFVPFEGRSFLNCNFPSSKKYQLLSYSLPSKKIRHVVFQGNRILLSRLSEGEEEIKSSLHFLSRSYPDLYDNIDTINLDEKRTSSYSHNLIEYMASQKKSSFSLHPLAFSKILWLRRVMGSFLSLLVLWMGIEIYESFDFKKKNISLLADNTSLIKTTDAPLSSQTDTPLLRHAVDQWS